MGIVLPMIRTAEDATRSVASLRYPPEDVRGFGAFLAQSRWQTDLIGYRMKMESGIVCCQLVETRDAIQNIGEICAVPGIDVLVPAQFDLSTDLGIPGQFDHPDFMAAFTWVEAAANATGLPPSNVALARPQATALFACRFRMIAGFDVLWLRSKAAENKSWCQGSA